MEDETVCGSTPHGLSIKMRHRLKLSNEFSLNPNQKWRSRCGIRLHLLASSAKRKLSCPAMCCVVGCHNPISRRISEAQGPRPQRIAIVSYGAGGPQRRGAGHYPRYDLWGRQHDLEISVFLSPPSFSSMLVFVFALIFISFSLIIRPTDIQA